MQLPCSSSLAVTLRIFVNFWQNKYGNEEPARPNLDLRVQPDSNGDPSKCMRPSDRHCTTNTMPKRKPNYKLEVRTSPTDNPEQMERNRHKLNVMVKYLLIHLNHLPVCTAVSSPDIIACSICRSIDTKMNAEMQPLLAANDNISILALNETLITCLRTL